MNRRWWIADLVATVLLLLFAAGMTYLLPGCSFSTPPAAEDNFCTPASPELPNCNGRLHSDECGARDLPHAYGTEARCSAPVLYAGFPSDSCVERPGKRTGCVESDTLLCCPE